MYKKLHRRLTLLFTGIAGAILIIMSISYLYMSEKELSQNHFLTFSSKASSLISNLEQQNDINWEYLSKTSIDQNFILAFYDNDAPLSRNQIVLSQKELFLIEKAKQYAEENFSELANGSSYLAAHLEFSFSADNAESYQASIFNIRKNNGILTGIILSSRQAFLDQLQRQRFRFLALNIIGIFILLFFSWYFTGKLITPIIEARKKQTAFIAAASHELRTPIAVIGSAISAAKSAEGEKKEHFFRIAEEESLRLSTLADDLLLLNRTDTGRFNLNKQPTELDTLLLNTFESFEPLAKEHCIDLQIQLPEESVPNCVCDGERIQQVLGIFISNALSYGISGGYVKLSLSYSDSVFWIMTEDNGVGIAAEDKPHIFDRFYRADKARSEKSHFGLGLSIAKEIIDAHGGKIIVADTPGGGTRFFILL